MYIQQFDQIDGLVYLQVFAYCLAAIVVTARRIGCRQYLMRRGKNGRGELDLTGCLTGRGYI